MKEQSLKHNTANRRRRLLLFAAVAVFVAVTAITVISRQKGRTTQAANLEATKAAASTAFFMPRVERMRCALGGMDSASERRPADGRSASTTRRPNDASNFAAAQPAGPAPITTTSQWRARDLRKTESSLTPY